MIVFLLIAIVMGVVWFHKTNATPMSTPVQPVVPVERSWKVSPHPDVVRDFNSWLDKFESGYHYDYHYDYEAASAYSAARALENAAIVESQPHGWLSSNLEILRSLPTSI